MDDAKGLIRQAFEQAMAAGKPDWYRMTSAVLKNRLLDITQRKFDETAYGALNFTDFLKEHADIVSNDQSVFPNVVELLQSERRDIEHRSTNLSSGYRRVREDLWRATLDYSSGTEYVWDCDEHQLRPRYPGETNPSFPSITEEILRQWRRTFIESFREPVFLTTMQKRRIEVWVEQLDPTYRLPVHFRRPWSNFLVEQVSQRLQDWFDESGIEPPTDILTVRSQSTFQREIDTETLRSFVIRVVGNMNESELAQLQLPPRAIIRVTRSR